MQHDHKVEIEVPQVEEAKTHFQKHKREYACLAIGFGVGVSFGLGVMFGRSISIAPVFNNMPTMENIVNTIVLPANGDPGDVVQNLRTLETYASKGELAKALGIDRTKVAKYFSGKMPDLLGDQFEIIGKAGHPIQLA